MIGDVLQEGGFRMKLLDLSGQWKVTIDSDTVYTAILPGTLDENSIGYKDNNKYQWKPSEVSEENNNNDTQGRKEVIKTRLTRAFTYEGQAVYCRTLDIKDHSKEDRVFLDVERSRDLALRLNGQELLPYEPGTLSTPYVFEVTKHLSENNTIELICDNSYKNWHHDEIVYSSTATDETQTNWNGILGYIRLRWEKQVFIKRVRVYPRKSRMSIILEIDASVPYAGLLRLSCPIFEEELVERNISIDSGVHTITFDDIAISKDCKRWDEYEGNLYELSASADGIAEKCVTFGVRDFEDNGNGRLALNGRTIFLRSEANCCVFPETGHMPLSVKEWLDILQIYKSYGINCVRFHSHCPPEAAFTAADQLGILMQPELSHWNPNTAFEDEKSVSYYRMELTQILLAYANHPSFVMLTFGNELAANEIGHQHMDELLFLAKSIDRTRMYASGSNNHYGQMGADANSDFYTSSNFHDKMLRATSSPMIGYLNQNYPNAKSNYNDVMEAIRKEYKGPVFSFEVGQYEVLPDFDEIECFKGVTIPDNLSNIKQDVIRKGFISDWKKRVEATGELAKIAYREEIEAVLRTRSLSGISLLGLQDFPGQGTALIGMLNSHLCPKPYPFAQAESFQAFFCEVLPMALLDKYTYTNKETLTAVIQIANYGKKAILAPTVYELSKDNHILAKGELPAITMPFGDITVIGQLSIFLEGVQSPEKLMLRLSIAGHKNEYPIWVYPDHQKLDDKYPDDQYPDKQYPDAQKLDDQGIVITRTFAETELALEKGSKVFYTPISDEEHFPHSVKSQFTTDFWSVGTFPEQSGCMGCLIETSHPIFKEFPTESHTNWQWWPMTRRRAIILPDTIKPIVTVLDSYARLRNMALLFECNVGKGKLIVSSMGLLEQQNYPEVRAFTHAIIHYMKSDHFIPKQDMTIEELGNILA